MRRRFRLRSPSSFKLGRANGWHALPHVSRFVLAMWMLGLASGCSGHSASGPALHRVVIQAFKFEPDSLTVAAGDTVEWLNRDLVPHTATAKSGHWNSNSVLPTGSWRVVMSTPGREPYGCQLHPTMSATIEVR